jgi:Zn-dependent M28 family amino/carboxypeptidase
MRILLLLLIFCAQSGFAQYSFDSEKLITDLKYLSSDELEGRKTGSSGSTKAREFIINDLKANKIEAFVPEYIQQFSFTQTFGMVETVKASNILAVIPGFSTDAIVLSAHYDHVGVNNKEVYNGADDNASGVAAVLAIAKELKKASPKHTIIVAFFDAEERGLKGSAHFVNTFDLQKQKIIANINLDMVSRGSNNRLIASGGFHYPHIKAILQNVKTPEGITLEFGYDDPILKRNDWTSQSDQYNFHLKKIPFVYFGVEDHPDYHKPTDDFEKVNQGFYKNSVETILQCVKALDKHLD